MFEDGVVTASSVGDVFYLKIETLPRSTESFTHAAEK